MLAPQIVCAVVHVNNVSRAKRKLFEANIFLKDPGIGIKSATAKDHAVHCKQTDHAAKVIPTTLQIFDPDMKELDVPIDSVHDRSDICCFRAIEASILKVNQKSPNALIEALKEAIIFLPDQIFARFRMTSDQLLQEFPTSFLKYTDLLLLSASLGEHWTMILTEQSVGSSASQFLDCLARVMSVKVIAIETHIPAQDASNVENVIRHPSNIRVIHGDGGPLLPPFPIHDPTTSDFEHAFWTSTTQFGLIQIWAPRYTMFSKGNVTEKQRIINHMPSISQVNAAGPWTAIDMFAGIGYFALPYAKAGAEKVICWDINPWSVEGLRRGILKNGYSAKIVKDRAPLLQDGGSRCNAAPAESLDEKFLVFNESNEMARERLNYLEGHLPPVRHVNCGMLPTSAMAWKNAVHIIDRRLGGWVHVHESCLVKEKNAVVENIRVKVQAALEEKLPTNKTAVVEDVVTVKSMGPALIHIVVDIHIPGTLDD